MGLVMGVQLLLLQAKHCAGGKKDSLLQNEQVPKVVLQCLNNQLDTEIACDNLIISVGFTNNWVCWGCSTYGNVIFTFSDGSEE